MSASSSPGSSSLARPVLYDAAPHRRALQVAGDVALVLWLLLAVWLGVQVHDALGGVSEQVRKVHTAGATLQSGLGSAGDTLSGAPVVGDEIASPFDRAAGASGDLARAGTDTADRVERLGTLLGVVTALLLALLVAPRWVAGRLRFVRTATLTRAFLERGGDPDLLALRALTRPPLTAVVRLPDDVVARWRAGDPDVVEELAGLELRRVGLPPLRA